MKAIPVSTADITAAKAPSYFHLTRCRYKDYSIITYFSHLKGGTAYSAIFNPENKIIHTTTIVKNTNMAIDKAKIFINHEKAS